MVMNACRQAYFSGIENFNNGDFRKAQECFLVASRDEAFREDAYLKILVMDFKEGKLSLVRNLLKDVGKESPIYNKHWGLLEKAEYNLKRSRDYYEAMFNYPNMQHCALWNLGKLYMDAGYFEMARAMFETMKFNDIYKLKANFNLILVDILEKKIEDAMERFKTIDINELNERDLEDYKTIGLYINYFGGNVKTFTANSNLSYLQDRLVMQNEEKLIKHIDRHLNQENRDTNGCFFKFTDTKKLLGEARERIINIRPNHGSLADIYRFKLDTPIGFIGGEITSDLGVTTLLGTKDVITMYPVKLSEEFNIEGMQENRDMQLKRGL